jgi:hypothetical protein
MKEAGGRLTGYAELASRRPGYFNGTNTEFLMASLLKRKTIGVWPMVFTKRGRQLKLVTQTNG